MRPRDFASGDNGYHNASLGTTGVAVAFPANASGCVVQVGAGCYIGLRDSATLATFSDANYGSILSGMPHQIKRWSQGGDAETHLHLAAWTGTSSVAIYFF